MPHVEQFALSPDAPSPSPWDASPCAPSPDAPSPWDRAPSPDVSTRLRALDAALPHRDGVAVFHRAYLGAMTETQRAPRAGRLSGVGAAAALEVRFTGRYLAAVDAVAAGRQPPACWRPLFQLRRHPGVTPAQFALAGINAHVGHDLALAVVDACDSLGCEPGDLEGEFDRVGELLAALEEGVREELMPGPDLLLIADPLTHLVGSWSLERARDAAWSAARALWALRHLPDLAAEFTDGLDAAVGLVGRMLLTPLPDGPGFGTGFGANRG